MKEGTRLAGLVRIVAFPIALMLVLSLFPLAGVTAQEQEQVQEPEPEPVEEVSTLALSEVPSTGARRPGPIRVISWSISAPRPAERAEGFAPVAFQVDKIGVDAPIEVGAVVDGAMQDPSGPWVVAWYEQLGLVGEGYNVVVSGHVDYYNSGPGGVPGPAVFWDMPALQPGDIIRMVGPENETMEYAVEWSRIYNVASELTPEVIQNDIVGDTGQESLTVITCGGPFDPATGQYLERWVIRANQVVA
jgi:sortase (surface protein transpeptidase)